MAPVLSWILVALVGAAVVIVVAGRAGGRSGDPRPFVATLRSGLRRDGGPSLLSDVRRDHAEAADVETGSVEDVFLVGRPDDRDYLLPPDLTELAGRVRSRDDARR